MRPSRLAPYPYDVTLTHPEVGSAGLMLSDGGQGKVIRHRHKGLDQVTPTSYSYGAQSPFRARQSVFARLVMGYGQPVQLEEQSQRYDHALGMDWSCGLGVLATRWDGPLTLPPGPIKDIKQMTVSGVRRLFVLSGQKLYVSNKTTITTAADFDLVRDFGGEPVAPPAPTATPIGAPGTADRYYRLQYGTDTAPPSSLLSPLLHVTTAPPVFGSRGVRLTFPPSPDGLPTYVYVSDNGIDWTPWLVAAGIGTFDDLSPLVGGTALPDGGTSSTGTTYQLTPTYYTGPLLVVGMDTGSYWLYDPELASGGPWIMSAEDGRAFAQQGYHYYRSSHWDPAHVRSRINAAYHTISPPWQAGTSGVSPTWPVLYQSGGQTPITRLAPMGQTLIVCEEGRIGIGASGEIPNQAVSMDITPDRSSAPHPDNGRVGTIWQGSLYTPYGSGFYKITPTGLSTANVEAIGPERLIENTSAVKGRVTGLAGWGPWHLFYALWDGQTSYLCKYGAWVNPEASNSPQAELLPVSHGALESWPLKVNWLEISGVGAATQNPRLYAGFVDGSIRWTTLPAQSPFAPTDDNCRYRSSGYTVLSRHTMGFQLDGKRYQHLTAFGPVLTPTARVRYFYTLPDGEERELSGEVTENGAPLDFPLNVEGKWIQIRVELETDDPTVTPVVEGFALEEQLNPASIEEISFSAHVGPHIMLASRHPTRRSAALLVETLRRLEGRGDDVLLTLPDGTVQRVAIIDLADHYLSGDSFAGERHEVGLTLVTFKTNTPTPLFGGL